MVESVWTTVYFDWKNVYVLLVDSASLAEPYGFGVVCFRVKSKNVSLDWHTIKVLLYQKSIA